MDSPVVPELIIENGDHKDTKKVSTQQRSSSRGGWNAAIFIIFVEVAERFAFYGVVGNLITYLITELHQPTATAVKNVNTWVGVSTLFPVLGAFVADSFLGRLIKTILISSVTFILGTFLLTLSVSVSVIPMHSREALFFTNATSKNGTSINLCKPKYEMVGEESKRKEEKRVRRHGRKKRKKKLLSVETDGR